MHLCSSVPPKKKSCCLNCIKWEIHLPNIMNTKWSLNIPKKCFITFSLKFFVPNAKIKSQASTSFSVKCVTLWFFPHWTCQRSKLWERKGWNENKWGHCWLQQSRIFRFILQMFIFWPFLWFFIDNSILIFIQKHKLRMFKSRWSAAIGLKNNYVKHLKLRKLTLDYMFFTKSFKGRFFRKQPCSWLS